MPNVFQAVAVKMLSGVSKMKPDGKGGNNYSMMIVSGIFTDDDGVMEVGEVSFMLGRDRTAFPEVKPGVKYFPHISARSVEGKLQFAIADLRPIAASAVAKAA